MTGTYHRFGSSRFNIISNNTVTVLVDFLNGRKGRVFLNLASYFYRLMFMMSVQSGMATRILYDL